MISDTKDGLSDCVYDQTIVLVYFCSDIVILVLTGKGGKPVAGGKKIASPIIPLFSLYYP